jgi:hypothetical protein
MLFWGTLFLLIFALINGFASVEAQEDKDKVESVEVQLNVAGQIYEGLQERIEYSIGRVGEKILLDHSRSWLSTNQEAVKTAIFNVFSKVLIGFKIEKVDLIIGSHTKVIIYLKPVPPLIQAVKLNIEVNGLTPELVAFTKEIASKVEIELNRIFVGLPVESVSWAEGIFNLVANYLLERELPGFESRFSLRSGVNTTFDIRIIPEEPIVSVVKVDCKAENIPVFFVRHKINAYRDRFNLLKGLPVEFLNHYQLRLQNYLTGSLNDFPSLNQAGMKVNIGIEPGVKTKVELTVNSEIFLVKFDARYGMNEKESHSNFETYLGYRSERYELFSRWYPFGKNPTGNIFAGCYFPLGPNFSGGFEYELEHGYKNIGFHFQFERGDYLDLRLGIDSPTEGIIGIYLNDFLNLELVDCDNILGIQFKFHF